MPLIKDPKKEKTPEEFNAAIAQADLKAQTGIDPVAGAVPPATLSQKPKRPIPWGFLYFCMSVVVFILGLLLIAFINYLTEGQFTI
jgi:hypothetical protein